jgi:hypothetical protein
MFSNSINVITTWLSHWIKWNPCSLQPKIMMRRRKCANFILMKHFHGHSKCIHNLKTQGCQDDFFQRCHITFIYWSITSNIHLGNLQLWARSQYFLIHLIIYHVYYVLMFFTTFEWITFVKNIYLQTFLKFRMNCMFVNCICLCVSYMF